MQQRTSDRDLNQGSAVYMACALTTRPPACQNPVDFKSVGFFKMEKFCP